MIFASVVYVSRFQAWNLSTPFLCQLCVISLRVRFAVSIHFALLYHALSFISCHCLFYFFIQLVHVNRFWAWICIATFICQLCVSSLRVKFVVSIHFSHFVSCSEYYFIIVSSFCIFLLKHVSRFQAWIWFQLSNVCSVSFP